MARIRTIKPDFFKHEDLAELPAMVRLLFIGLWTQADRAGRLEDRPKRLKVEIFPYENYDVEKGLKQLVDGGFIERYKAVANHSVEDNSPRADGHEIPLIQITNFLKHQQPHVKEKESTLPAPCKNSASTPVYGNGEQERKGNGKQEGNGASAADAAGSGSGSTKDPPPKKEKGSAQKEKAETPHWLAMMKVWEGFYTQHFDGLEPTTNATSCTALKSILTRLQKHSAINERTKDKTWTEEYAIKVFTHFLTRAYADPWRSQNFRLTVLSSHYDSIITGNEHKPNTTGGKQATGGNVDSQSAFSKIDALYGGT